MLKKTQLASAVGALGLGLGVVATAAFAAEADPGENQAGTVPTAEIEVIEREGDDFRRAIDDHRTEELSGRYRDLYAAAEDLGVEPRRNLVARPGEPELDALTKQVGQLRDDVEKARESDGPAAGSGDYALVGGVSQETLDAIAACESGGDPTAVNAAGYYGKYQFDMGTWASVGGSGNPAEASEAEQDMRASMLYAQAGSTPWPVCGQ